MDSMGASDIYGIVFLAIGILIIIGGLKMVINAKSFLAQLGIILFCGVCFVIMAGAWAIIMLGTHH